MSVNATLETMAAPAAVSMHPAEGADLAELISAFNEVTARLQQTHESLRAEVARLERELREARQQLQRARELASLGEMAAGIAHEVRNPLGSIRLYVSALARDLADRPSEQDLARKIGGAVSRLDAVVQDVIAFAKERSARLSDVPASELIEEALAACADLIEGHRVRVVRPPESRQRLNIHCDAALMRQSLVNIVRNACQAMAESASHPQRDPVLRFEIERRRALSPDGDRRDMIAIEVSDNGPGVSDAARERIFAPFFTTRHTGTGLGLSIVHRMVDAHGGRVHIRNRTGRRGEIEGATVEILLPAEHFRQHAERGDL